jgi:hypothetical protein
MQQSKSYEQQVHAGMVTARTHHLTEALASVFTLLSGRPSRDI